MLPGMREDEIAGGIVRQMSVSSQNTRFKTIGVRAEPQLVDVVIGFDRDERGSDAGIPKLGRDRPGVGRVSDCLITVLDAETDRVGGVVTDRHGPNSEGTRPEFGVGREDAMHGITPVVREQCRQRSFRRDERDVVLPRERDRAAHVIDVFVRQQNPGERRRGDTTLLQRVFQRADAKACIDKKRGRSCFDKQGVPRRSRRQAEDM